MPYKYKSVRLNYLKKYRLDNRKLLLIKKKLYWKNVRVLVLDYYSKGKLECKCCREKNYEFLCLDHIHGGGNKHRASLKSKYIYNWLIQNNFPKGFQVLCANCNMAKIYHKCCPHKRLTNDNS